MSRIAVDIVLLPDREMTDRAIRMNRGLVGSQRTEIVLNAETCLPHVSLAMGCVEEDGVEAVRVRMAGIAERTSVRRLTAVGISVTVNARGEETSLLDIERTNELKALHETVMEEIGPLLSHEVNESMIRDDIVAPTTLAWIRNYPDQAAFERFLPHITLGYGRTRSDQSFPVAFTASRLALCHLGNHCTCRTVLAAVNL